MMGFGTAIAECLHNYGNFYGRAQRSEYWWFSLFYALPIIVVGGPIVYNDGHLPEQLPERYTVLMLAGGVFWLCFFIPKLAVMVRRMHDIGVSGWCVLITLIPYVGGLITLVMLCLPGTTGENVYGPDPLERPSATGIHTGPIIH